MLRNKSHISLAFSSDSISEPDYIPAVRGEANTIASTTEVRDARTGVAVPTVVRCDSTAK